ncbi:MAG TPA: molybdopterin-dependent oxidoreductase [Longimicrobiales bacterium]|nr:molybdopterin-dependent oxidoreductase [Longimicrobiales bacterium]
MANEQQDTVNITLNGVEAAVPKNLRIIEAAEQLGVGIAHYCYHPGLSAPAMCRMCLVEVEGAPKLAPACVTPVAEGQVIHTESERARQAREGTLEFYLLNHPLDCPICDKSGECKLQDYTHAEGRKHGRSIEPKRVNGQDDFGGDILYDGDRCIMCTRCVRFMRELPQDDRLCVVQRGHRSVIDTFYDHGVEGNIWAGNIVDICPVGALLSKDFLHKARVWDLDGNASICPNCSQGCNIRIDSRDNLAVRLRPRSNADVNSYWMCDYGRHRYEWLNVADRVEAPLVRGENGQLQATSWQKAILALLEQVRAAQAGGAEVTVIGSPFYGNEDNGMLARLATMLGGGSMTFRVEQADEEVVMPGFPRLARRRDLAANVRGLEVMGFSRADGAPASAGGIVIALGDVLDGAPEDFAVSADLFIAITPKMTATVRGADFVLPAATFAEAEGTFTNHEGRVQRFWPALQPPPLARPAWQVLGVIMAGMEEGGTAPATAGDAFLRLGDWHTEFSGLSYDVIGSRGALINDTVQLPAGAGRGS